MELREETQSALDEFLRSHQNPAEEREGRGEEEDEEIQHIRVGDLSFEVKIPEAEWNDEKKTLFATMVWNGAKSLGHYLIQNARDKVVNRRVLEFGAGVGIPSLVCHSLGATFVCVSDYPTEHILSVIQHNILLNTKNQSEECPMDVVGYKWGSPVECLIEKNGHHLYDLIIASECLWRHEQVWFPAVCHSHHPLSHQSMMSFSSQSQQHSPPQAPPSSHFLIMFPGRSKMI